MKPPMIISEDETQKRLAKAPAPRVTEESIRAKIQSVSFKTVEGGTLCIIKLFNGWVSTGFSAPVSPENFDPDIGSKYAYEQAFKPLWQLEGYLLRQKLYEAAQ